MVTVNFIVVEVPEVGVKGGQTRYDDRHDEKPRGSKYYCKCGCYAYRMA